MTLPDAFRLHRSTPDYSEFTSEEVEEALWLAGQRGFDGLSNEPRSIQLATLVAAGFLKRKKTDNK